ncbi:MAG: DUF1080 domain-containing protein [Bacteroidetes bacterium]|nr:DUF1080 domain-containing protein [Bacteroidota bacterium]
MKIKFWILVLAISGTQACNTPHVAASHDADTPVTLNNGWQTLFDGNTTNGWHSYGKDKAGTGWIADNGILHFDPSKKDGGDLVTNESFKNFDLQLDWKISPGGNSGIIFYVNDNPEKYHYVWLTGPEMQIIDNEGHEDGKYPKHRAGDLYDLISALPESAKPVGEWNHAEIIALNGKLDFYLNSVHVVSTTMWDSNWDKMVAGSKFHEMPDFGKFREGHISLQDHGGDVWFKDIKIKKL